MQISTVIFNYKYYTYFFGVVRNIVKKLDKYVQLNYDSYESRLLLHHKNC